MPVRPDPSDPADHLLYADDGTPLARFRPLGDGGTSVADRFRPLPGAALDRVAAQAVRDLAGTLLDTPDEGLGEALATLGHRGRSATELRHDLTGVPEEVVLPPGWTLAPPGWDDDLAEGLAAAYGPDHPDGAWTPAATAEVRAMVDRGTPVPPLAGATARVVDPSGRSAGHVLCAGPVPWTADRCGWVLNLAVAPRAQGRGLGRALLGYALRGTAAAGLPTLGLAVTDGNAARRLYDAAGFRVHTRVISVRLP
jgi:ribosomal protein S18 acetylase RimI-like enzyme